MTDNKVCKDVTNSDQIVTEINLRTDVNSKEKLSNKACQIEREKKNLNKYFEAHQNNLSSNNETIYLNVELSPHHTEGKSFRPIDLQTKNVKNIASKETISRRISSAESVDDSKKHSYCCSSLNESGISAAGIAADVTNSDQIVTEINLRTDVNSKEKLSNKACQIEREKKNLDKYFEAHQNNLSSNNETIYLNVELPPHHTDGKSFRPIDLQTKNVKDIASKETVSRRISLAESVDDSKKHSYCCSSLNESGIAAAKFSIFLAIVLLLISAQKFFKSSGEEDTTTKMFVFSIGVYALCYLHCARKLINGIEKEMRNKFLAWIGFSIFSIFLLFSGMIYVVISSWDELKEIQNEPIAAGHVIALAVLLGLIACALIYCTRIVLILWNSLNVEENSSRNGSHANFICHFCNSCALSFSSFSRAVSH